MRATRILAITSLALILAGAAQAQPVYDYAWGGCFGTPGAVGPTSQTLGWTGGFSPYHQFVSATNVSSPPGESVFGHELSIRVGPNVPDAWRFDADGCMTANFGQITYNTLGVAGCPGLRVGAESASNAYQYDPVTQKALINVATGYSDGRLEPDPAALFLLYNFQFGMASAGSVCPGELDPLCFHIMRVALGIGETPLSAVLVPAIAGQWDWVTFNDPDNTTGCPGVTQVEESTWGQVKGLYR